MKFSQCLIKIGFVIYSDIDLWKHSIPYYLSLGLMFFSSRFLYIFKERSLARECSRSYSASKRQFKRSFFRLSVIICYFYFINVTLLQAPQSFNIFRWNRDRRAEIQMLEEYLKCWFKTWNNFTNLQSKQILWVELLSLTWRTSPTLASLS